MKFALFLGCNIPARVRHYDLSARAVLDRLDVDIVDIREFNCCGYPIRNLDFGAFVLSSARNLALAESRGLDIMTLCKCCYGSLKKANYLMKQDRRLRDETNAVLAEEGLEYKGNIDVTHLLVSLHKEIGLKRLKEEAIRPFGKLKIATHYGCHALRPSDIMQFDDPVSPVLFDQLVEVTGAKSIDWPLRLECCGAPLLGVNDELSMDLTQKKISDGRRCGADYLCSACPWCQLQFDSVQAMMMEERGTDHHLPSVLFPQLLGLAMGIDGDALGISMNKIGISDLQTFLP